MIHIEVVQSTFDNSTLRKLMEVLRLVNFNQPRSKIGKKPAT